MVVACFPRLLLAASLSVLLSACGGGGGGSDTAASPSGSANTADTASDERAVNISGYAVKGVISNGIITAWGVEDGGSLVRLGSRFVLARQASTTWIFPPAPISSSWNSAVMATPACAAMPCTAVRVTADRPLPHSGKTSGPVPTCNWKPWCPLVLTRSSPGAPDPAHHPEHQPV